MKKKPNVIYIVADQHNAKVIGAKGDPNVKTPNLDRLIREGVSFDAAISQNPVCTPSRVSLHSGQYCHNHGYYALEGDNPQGLPTILGHFRKAGYKTAAIGKIHCPMYWIEDDCDVFMETSGCSIDGKPEYSSFLQEIGKEDDNIAIPEFGKRGRQAWDGRASDLTWEESQEGFIVKHTLEFLEDCKQAHKPFIAHVSFPMPHECYVPSREFWDLYDENELVLPPNADNDMKLKSPDMIRQAESCRTGQWTLFEPQTFEAGRLRKLHGYLGCISQVDKGVGDIIRWLEENDMTKDTIVVYTSDHGDYACEYDIMEKAPGICSDAITRVPAIWWWDSHLKARAVQETVETVDIANTLCALAGLDPMETSDGEDYSPLLFGEDKQIHKIGVTENVWSKSVRKGKYRMVYYVKAMYPQEYPDGFGELYDMEADPFELHNLYFEAAYQDVIRDMKEDLLEWMITTIRPRTQLGYVEKKTDQKIRRYHHYVNADGKINPKTMLEGDRKRI